MLSRIIIIIIIFFFTSFRIESESWTTRTTLVRAAQYLDPIYSHMSILLTRFWLPNESKRFKILILQ